MMTGWRILKVTLSLPALLGFLLVAPRADAASPKNPEVFSRHQRLHSAINETTTNLIRGFVDHVSPRLDSAAAAPGAADPTYVSSYPSIVLFIGGIGDFD